jgi:hypothetical protein
MLYILLLLASILFIGISFILISRSEDVLTVSDDKLLKDTSYELPPEPVKRPISGLVEWPPVVKPPAVEPPIIEQPVAAENAAQQEITEEEKEAKAENAERLAAQLEARERQAQLRQAARLEAEARQKAAEEKLKARLAQLENERQAAEEKARQAAEEKAKIEKEIKPPAANGAVIQPRVNCVGSWVNVEGYICNIDDHCTNDKRSIDVYKKKRQRYEVTEEAKNGGSVCYKTDGEEREMDCINENIKCEIDCVGSWDGVSSIDKDRKNIMRHNICNINDHCTNDERSIGIYQKKLKRYVITQEARNGGKICEAIGGEENEMDCIDENVMCEIDCKGEWNAWSECDMSLCGGEDRVEQKRKYIIKANKQGNGRECEYDDEEKEAKTCACEALDCEGYFEDTVGCEIDTYCDPFEENQYKYKRQRYVIKQEARYGGKDCKYWDNENIVKICNGEDGTERVKCKVDCISEEDIKTECALDKCDIDPKQVIIKTGRKILRDAEGGGRVCEISNIETINCQDQCSPKDCTYKIGPYGECDMTDCNKRDNYSVKFELKLKDTWFNRSVKKVKECENKIINAFSNLVNVRKESVIIDDINENNKETIVEVKINEVSKYKSELIRDKINSINISEEVANDINNKIKCHREMVCEKRSGEDYCNTRGEIIKDCYKREIDNRMMCDVMELLSNELNINKKVEVKGNQSIIKRREYEKEKEARYGGECIKPTGDITTTCKSECPVDCIGIWERYGTEYRSECPTGEDARGKHMKQRMKYRVIRGGNGNACVDSLYGINNVRDGQIIEIDGNTLCPIDCIEEKQYSECNIFDDCGPVKDDGTYNKENALERQIKRRIMWIEKRKVQGGGRKCRNLPQLNEQHESCNPIQKCPISCIYR